MPRRSDLTSLLVCLALAAAPPACNDAKRPRNNAGYETVTVTIEGHIWKVELADTWERQVLGLGERNALAEGTGMLFVYPDAQPRTFVMRGMRIPLDIAFIGPDGVIVRTHTMTVEPDRFGVVDYTSGAPAQYVLEVSAGTFERLGIGRGDRVELDPSVLRRWPGS